MGLFSFFRNLTTKFNNEEIRRLPEPQYINNEINKEPVINKNAYVDAYSKQFNTKQTNFVKFEDGGKTLKINQNQSKMQVRGIKKLKESLKVEDGREIDLYSGVLEKNEKKNIVYFGVQNGVDLNEALMDKNKKNKVSNKMVKMFTVPNVKPSSKFIGNLVEDDIYKNYCITKSDRLENYVGKIEERRIQLLKQKRDSVLNEAKLKKEAEYKRVAKSAVNKNVSEKKKKIPKKNK